MKKEQIVDMIGQAPDEYIEDAKKYKKRRIPRPIKWVGAIAAVLAVVLLINNMPAIPMAISAKAVSVASESRKTLRPKSGAQSDDFEAWLKERDLREEQLSKVQTPIADFAMLCSKEVLTGSEDANIIWSPINAYIALAMTAELTGGQTKAQILDVLGVPDTGELRTNISAVWEEIYEDNGKEVSVLANSLWLDRDVDYVKEKMDILAHDYYASTYVGDLGSKQINKDIANWMHNSTRGFLNDRKVDAISNSDEQMLILASTIYFRSRWNDEFDKKNNTEGVFHSPKRDINCTFMNKKELQTHYYWGEDYGAVQVYFENGSSMWFILPDEDKTVDDVLANGEYMNMIAPSKHESLANETAATSTKNRKYMKVNLSVPQFDVSSSLNLVEDLKSIGITELFNPSLCDFSPSVYLKDQPMYVAAINQSSRVEIDEDGVTAASYIEIIGAGAAMPPDEIIDFVLDRPFVFAITKSNLPLFVGTVNNP